jgi:hypothetical protein
VEAKEKLKECVETQKKMVKRLRQESAVAFERSSGWKFEEIVFKFSPLFVLERVFYFEAR